MRFRLVIAFVAAVGALAGCGGSDGSAASGEIELASSTTAAVSSTTSAADPEETTTTTTDAPTTTTTTATTTTTTTTTTAAPDAAADGVVPAARDLRLVALSPADVGDGYEENFANIAPQGGLPLIAPCGQDVVIDTPFQAASNWIYPVDQLGWPPNGVLYDVLMIAHQVTGDADDVVAQVSDVAAGCDGSGETFTWTRGGGSVEASSTTLTVPEVRGVRGAGYLLTTDVDTNAYVEYVLASEDVVVTLFLIGAAPSANDLPALAEPIVTQLQGRIADCFETPECVDANA